MKQVAVFPRGQLSAKDKERLSRAGVVAVEADDPSKVVTVLPMTQVLSADEVVTCLAQAIQVSSSAMSTFGTAMAKRIAARSNR